MFTVFWPPCHGAIFSWELMILKLMPCFKQSINPTPPSTSEISDFRIKFLPQYITTNIWFSSCYILSIFFTSCVPVLFRNASFFRRGSSRVHIASTGFASWLLSKCRCIWDTNSFLKVSHSLFFTVEILPDLDMETYFSPLISVVASSNGLKRSKAFFNNFKSFGVKHISPFL